MGGIDAEKIAQEAINAIADKIKNLHTLNIIVAGKTGVGKSTLINAVFKDKLAETGMGKPVTTHMRKINKKGRRSCMKTNLILNQNVLLNTHCDSLSCK